MECMNKDCNNELTGKQTTYCSDRCRMQASRTQPEHEQPEQSKSNTITEQQIDALPVGVVKPGRSDVAYFNTGKYRATIAKLINSTKAQLKASSTWIPNWKGTA